MTATLLLAGFALLLAGAEFLVRGASRLAKAFAIPPLVIGLTVVAFGTSAPELAVSLQAALDNRADIALGNVVGSNIFNVLFILGLSALITPLFVSRKLVRLEVPIMIGTSLLLMLMGWNGQIGRGEGDVIDIGILRTTLMECGEWVKGDQYNGRVVRVANSFVFKEPVFNYSGEFPFLWDEITVPVKYGCDHHLARELLLRVAGEVVGQNAASAKGAWKQLVQRYLIEDAKVDPMVTMVANDNWMEFTLRYLVDFKKRRATKDQLFSRILDEIAASDGRVALASATFQIVETPVLDVRLEGGTEPKVVP